MKLQEYIDKVLAQVGVKKKKVSFELKLDQYGQVSDLGQQIVSFEIKRGKMK
jgi:hypothetical protein